MPKVVVIGAGVSGLTIGWELLSRGLAQEDLAVLEAGDRPGGNIWTEKVDGFTVEAGPNGFLNNSPPTLDLVGRLGMDDRLLPSRSAAAIRFIFRKGRLHRLPTSPPALLGSPLLSWPGRLRIFMEPLIPKGGGPDESVFDFAARRIGREAAAVLVDAMVSGVFAGDARRLELRAAFPRMADMEERYGGLVKAFLAMRKRQRPRPGAGAPAGDAPSAAAPRGGPAGPGGHLTSFKDGMEELVRTLAARLGSSLRPRSAVAAIAREGPSFRIDLSGGERLSAEALVLSCPAPIAARLVRGLDGDLASALGDIPTAPVAVVATMYKLADLEREPFGFGFLVPRGQGVRILGSLWTSSIWEGRAPEGTALLRTMIGGAHDPDGAFLDDAEMLDVVARDLAAAMGLTAAPVLHRIYRHRLGIPQYPPGHTALRLRIRKRLNESHPGLFVSGSSYGGVSVNHCVAEAPKVADRVMERLGAAASA